MPTRTFIDVHILQDLPPANINRDQSGSPKTAVYGGVPRLRVSSQAWKRATRQEFNRTLPASERGVRTRRLQQHLSAELAAKGVEDPIRSEILAEVLATLGIKAGKNNAELLSYLLFCGREQLDQVVDRMVALESTWAGLTAPERRAAAGAVGFQDALSNGHSLDVALFGRMVADLGQINVDAAVQVAHALSTHAAPSEFDYFTAVDDIPGQDKDGDADLGAGMIGTVEFNSGTLYRFATIALHQLVENLGDPDAAVEGVRTFIRAFALSMPSGHQNSFAARTRPSVIGVVVRDDQPVNLVSAFEKPVYSDRGYLDGSQRALATTLSDESARWGDKPAFAAASYAATGAQKELEAAFGASLSLEELLEGLDVVIRPRA